MVLAPSGQATPFARSQSLSLVVALCVALVGCAESQFVLAPESRIPAWFTLPDGMTRSQVNVVFTYYSDRAVVTLYGPDRRVLARTEATRLSNYPIILGPDWPENGPLPDPSYEVWTANGVSEVVEHRRMEPICYITDDPEIRGALGVARFPSDRSAGHTDWSVVLPGATKIRLSTEGNPSVLYELSDEYPAERTLRALGEQLERQGWKPLVEDAFNPPGETRDREWGTASLEDGTWLTWVGQWINDAADVVQVDLRYATIDRDRQTHASGSLEVTIVLVAAAKLQGDR